MFPRKTKEPLFARGFLKYLMLYMIRKKPMHGYELIKVIEDEFLGLYKPSPGVIYPTLQSLEERGYIEKTESEGRKIYSITNKGRKFLEEKAEVIKTILRKRGRITELYKKSPLRDLLLMSKLIFLNWGKMEPKKAKKISDIIAKTRKEVEKIFSEVT